VLLAFFHEFVNSQDWIQFLSVLFGVLGFLFFSQISTKKEKGYDLGFRILFILIIFLVSFHFLASSIDFYRLISPPQLFYTLKLHRLITLSGAFLVHIFLLITSFWFLSKRKKYKKISLAVSTSSIVLLFIVVTVVFHTEKALANSYTDITKMILNSHSSSSEKITYKFGGAQYTGWIQPYTEFIKKYTEEDSTIIIPPQSMVWQILGNSGVLRSFLYPRKLVHGDLSKDLSDQAEYVLIAIGDCGEGDCGWPKINIPADKIEYIALINRETQEETIITDRAYTLNKDEFKWGIIKLR